MKYQNKVQLITYVDRLSGGTVQQLHQMLKECFPNVFGGIHLLPFYNPIDGEDAGFDPIDHTSVDARLGNWDDVQALGQDFDLMADMIVNHMSAQSIPFQDVLAKGKDSTYWDLFLTKQKVFGDKPNPDDIANIFRPRPTSPFTKMTLGDGSEADFWTTFTANQIDIDVASEQGKAYLDGILTTFSRNNIKLIRLDAAGYAIKQAGTNCFMMPQTFAFIEALSSRAEALGMTCLVEIHSYHKIQCEIAKRCSLVYDFALPPLVLHAMNTKDLAPLATWLEMSPRNCVTVLDTHDGIGIVDVGANGDEPGLLTPEQIDTLVESIHDQCAGESRAATGSAANNVDLYQVNCTYYSALGCDDYRYLLSRAIQFFCPGIPQVYYTGLLALPNDMDLLAKSQVGRDINRSYLDLAKVQQHAQKSVVQALLKLIQKRNQNDAFAGEFSQVMTDERYSMRWANGTQVARLDIDLATLNAHVAFDSEVIELRSWL
ncbi:sucrose phosphorylase [Alteromonas sp. LMIT006]|jgi:sucrose phosphorylase|uniref:sucrose phosphorylase n=1 Tax=Alteromonadaceae TaxID=72275 RepID=UPI0020CA4434|nr:sucrose phosphorylase [Alteromonas sp. LMIT006]UTP73510.1 sucrose phosphorylase [Alteromonas sp. LMIT006]